jgi:ABC-type multidrug transport system fused ATPase/permease subunit
MALGRVLVRDSVDFETDMEIQNTIVTASKGKTSLCIANRLKTRILFHRIVVMDQGQIAGLDNAVRLIDSKCFFWGAYKLQWRTAVNA